MYKDAADPQYDPTLASPVDCIFMLMFMNIPMDMYQAPVRFPPADQTPLTLLVQSRILLVHFISRKVEVKYLGKDPFKVAFRAYVYTASFS